jgi:hypothetical protein
MQIVCVENDLTGYALCISIRPTSSGRFSRIKVLLGLNIPLRKLAMIMNRPILACTSLYPCLRKRSCILSSIFLTIFHVLNDKRQGQRLGIRARYFMLENYSFLSDDVTFNQWLPDGITVISEYH